MKRSELRNIIHEVLSEGKSVIKLTKRDWDKKDKTFSFYSSDKPGHPGGEKEVWLKSPSGTEVKFVFVKADMVYSHAPLLCQNYFLSINSITSL